MLNCLLFFFFFLVPAQKIVDSFPVCMLRTELIIDIVELQFSRICMDGCIIDVYQR